MIFCDHTPSIVEWGSEEVIIPYRCPTDGRVHRYYPDFYVKVVDKQGISTKNTSSKSNQRNRLLDQRKTPREKLLHGKGQS